MSNKGNDRAYPQGYPAYGGMTIRQRFAMAAMQGYVASNRMAGDEGIDDKTHDELIARWSVEMADALLAALENQP